MARKWRSAGVLLLVRHCVNQGAWERVGPVNKPEPDFYSDPAIIDRPKDYFGMLRARAPVAWEPHHGTLMVTGFDEANGVPPDKWGVYSTACSVVGPTPGLPFEPQAHDITGQ